MIRTHKWILQDPAGVKQNVDKFDKHDEETKEQFLDDNYLHEKYSSYLRKLDAVRYWRRQTKRLIECKLKMNYKE